jgi:hypothetical protein
MSLDLSINTLADTMDGGDEAACCCPLVKT